MVGKKLFINKLFDTIQFKVNGFFKTSSTFFINMLFFLHFSSITYKGLEKSKLVIPTNTDFFAAKLL